MTEIQFISIASRWDSDCTLYRGQHATLREALVAAVASSANLSGANLRDANLGGVNLTGANLRDANLGGVNLTGANLSGANLSGADLSGANLGGVNLSNADLTGANLTGANLRDANLGGVNLRDANLSGANLRDANLGGVNLTGANLSGADLSDADLAVPVVQDLEKIIEEATRADGSLEMGSWHSCATTHCRAGWAIHLAGEPGAALERRVGPATAGALIYFASAGYVPDFYATNEDARADIVARAKV